MSSSAPLVCGVPRGSILGPLVFSHLAPYSAISFHCYADDTQIYASLKKNDTYSLKVIFDCLDDMKAWMAFNQLIKPHITNLGVKRSFWEC